jgi:hypothetical protein
MEYFCCYAVFFDNLFQESRVYIGPIKGLVNPMQIIGLDSGLTIIKQLVAPDSVLSLKFI